MQVTTNFLSFPLVEICKLSLSSNSEHKSYTPYVRVTPIYGVAPLLTVIPNFGLAG